tara:strand:- start:100 stop:345 length:246 start_codon:yes stop_codon:yes gene_type:complete
MKDIFLDFHAAEMNRIAALLGEIHMELREIALKRKSKGREFRRVYLSGAQTALRAERRRHQRPLFEAGVLFAHLKDTGKYE